MPGAAVEKAIEEIIESSKDSGEREKLVAWETRLGKPVTVGEVRDLANWCDYWRGTGHMLSAQRMSVQLQVIAEELKADNPGVFAPIQSSSCRTWMMTLNDTKSCCDYLILSRKY